MDEEPDAAVSLPLGAGRLTRDLLPGDPPAQEAVRAGAPSRSGRPSPREVRPLTKAGAPDRAVGTSKTMRSLARIAGAAPEQRGPVCRARASSGRALGDVVQPLSRDDRAPSAPRCPGVSAARASQLLAGAIVAEAAMDLLGVDRLDICPWALREGLILQRLDSMG